MEQARIIAGHGLLRLLASHVVLRHQVLVVLWAISGVMRSFLRETLQGDCDALDQMVRDLGAASAWTEVRPPWQIEDLVRLSSIQSDQRDDDTAAQLRVIRAGHQRIIDDIETLEVVMPEECDARILSLCSDLKPLHAAWRRRLAGAYDSEG